MNVNIEVSAINTHFFSYNKKEQEISEIEIPDKKLYNTKMINYCFYSINEANISDNIKDMLYYSNNYLVVEDYDFINISQLNEKYIEKLNLKNTDKYLLFKYKNEHLIDFNDYLFNFTDSKRFIFSIIESFSYILQSLEKLNANNICFFNLSPQNIGFSLNNPILHNFQTSLQISKLSQSYITNIIKKVDNYTHKPLEVHVLFYLIQNDIFTISSSFIEEICEVFIKNLSILTFFSKQFCISYKLACKEFLTKYINKPKLDIINDILQYNGTWDVYSFSILYLHIFGSLTHVFMLKDTFINKMAVELSKNIHPDPLKRNNLEKLLDNYNKLFNNQKDWNFVNNLSSSKMNDLFTILSK